MPNISIIVPTSRIGGLDILFSSLENQIFKDFELILIDSLYDKREHIVKDKMKQFSFIIKHIPSKEEKFTATNYCKAMNTGIINSSGNLAYFTCDYTWLTPECLQIHNDFHKTNINTGLLCSYVHKKLPKLNSIIDNVYYSPEPYTIHTESSFINNETNNFTKYLEDLNNDKFKDIMYSIFEEEFNIHSNINTLEHEQNSERPEGYLDINSCFLKNESYTLKDLIEINGLNEELDGSHGWQDIELVDRLKTLLNTKFCSKSITTNIIINPRTVLGGRLRNRAVFSNETIWKTGKLQGFRNKVNNYTLKDFIK